MKAHPVYLDEMLRVLGLGMASLRKRRGLTQVSLAELTGLSVNTISNIERGTLDPTVVVVALMQVHLGALGLELAGENYTLVESPRSDGPLPFPNLAKPPAAIVMMIGERIKNRRQRMKMTLEALSADSGIHINTLWNLEHGLVAPSISTLFRVYRSLGVRSVIGTPDGIELLP
jgi:transcriptional regulator with XRE-family HTH domain